MPIQFIRWKYIHFFVYLHSVQPSPQSILEDFHHFRKKPCTLYLSPCTSFISYNPKKWLIYFVSIDYLIPDISYKWNHIRCDVSYDWMLSLNTMFLRFMHVVACIRTSFLGQILFHFMDIPHFVYPFISWWTFRLFLLFGFYE